MMVIMVIILGIGDDDVFVNCDRRFGRWWTRRFLPVCVPVGLGSGDRTIIKVYTAMLKA